MKQNKQCNKKHVFNISTHFPYIKNISISISLEFIINFINNKDNRLGYIHITIQFYH